MFGNFKKIIKKIKWKKKNHNNFTRYEWCTNFDSVDIGNYTYGPIYVECFGGEDEKLIIGNFCSIASGVKFLLGGEHDYKTISTYPFNKLIYKSGIDAKSKGKIIVDDDVWIGYNSLIMSGVHIGQGAIIGAGSIVTKDVEPYSIVAGCPAKHIKYRFEKEIIDELLKIDFSKFDDDSMKNLNKLLNTHLNKENYKEIINELINS